MSAWEEALQNIVWVLDLDGGARARFDKHYQGIDPSGYPLFPEAYHNAFRSVIAAQAHNEHAQATIYEHSQQAQRYLLDRGFMLG